jgi:hypothetical protein|tara:strand:- start:1779 stop:2135 length:357 start_codon:yes stop_codon:yes gene_type:complete
MTEFLTTKRKDMAISPTQRTLKRLRDSGDYPLVTIVERWNAWAKIRQDLFGIIDILAIDSKGNTVGIQVTTKGNMGARVKKIADHESTPHLRDANWIILVEGWEKESNRWKSNIIDLS